jgi:hypothetical protein
MAIIAAREFERQADQLRQYRKSAVYTFGAPRAGDYKYFLGMKTPVYRIVNSSDAVPLVPLGFFNNILLLLFKGIRFLCTWRQGKKQTGNVITSTVYTWFNAIENKLDKVGSYRHTGDLRYLTDVASSESITTVEILPNPCQFDRINWLVRSVLVSFGRPLKNHSMQIYRNKLTEIMKRRNTAAKDQ